LAVSSSAADITEDVSGIDIPVIDFVTPIVGQILDLSDTSAFDNYDNCLT
jgi:hypothetical protein